MLHQSDAKLKPIVTLATCVFTLLRPVVCLKFECSLHGPCDFDLLLLHCIGGFDCLGVRPSIEKRSVGAKLPHSTIFCVFFRLLSSLLPETQVVLDTVLSNREKWQKAQEDGDYVYRPVATSDKEVHMLENGNVPSSPSS